MGTVRGKYHDYRCQHSGHHSGLDVTAKNMALSSHCFFIVSNVVSFCGHNKVVFKWMNSRLCKTDITTDTTTADLVANFVLQSRESVPSGSW